MSYLVCASPRSGTDLYSLPDDLTEGFGKLGASASFAQVSGRGLASGLIAAIGAARAITADAFSYAVSVTCLLLIRGNEPRPERKTTDTKNLRQDISQDLIFIMHHPVLRKTIACTAAGNFFIAREIALSGLAYRQCARQGYAAG